MRTGSASRINQVSRMAPRQSYWVPLRLLPYGWWNPELGTIDTSASRNSFSAINALGTGANNLTQSTKANQPTVTTRNGRKAISYVAASSYSFNFSNLSMLANQTKFYFFATTQCIDVAATEMPLLSGTTNNAAATRLVCSAFTQGSPNIQLSARRVDGGSIVAVSTPATTTAWQSLEYLVRWDNATGSLWQNGVQLVNAGSLSGMGTGSTSNTASTALRSGRGASSGTSSNYYNGTVLDQVALRSLPTDVERLMLRNWANKRAGVFF